MSLKALSSYLILTPLTTNFRYHLHISLQISPKVPFMTTYREHSQEYS
jgi:hypothetical protein